MTKEENNPIAAYTKLRVHKFKTVIKGRFLSFELPPDLPLGEVEVIVLIDEEKNVDRDNTLNAPPKADQPTQAPTPAQALIRKYAPANSTSVVDEFIAERRAAADSE